MKKLLKNVLVFSLLAAICVALAGCGDKDDKSSNKKDSESSISGSKYFENGEYTETITADLDKDGNATKFTITMEFSDNEKADAMKGLAEQGLGTETATVKVEDNKVIIEMSAEEFLKEEGLSYDYDKISKDQVKELFEKNDFKVEE